MTENEKILINNERTTKQVTLVFPNHEINDIDNTQVYQESFDLEESLFDGESLTFGKCNASLFKIRVADFTENIKDAEMDVYVTFTNPDTAVTSLTVPFGKYIVQSVERTSDRRWRDITAVDFMSKFDTDIADWYNTTLYPTSATTHTISEIRTALCQRIGVTQASVTLVNDSLTISKAVEPSALSARELLQYICEINGVFGHFDWSGTLQYISLEVTHGLYPSVTLFPSTNLFPRRATTTSGVQNENVETFRECDYEDYDVERIDSVAIVKEDGNVGVYYNINPTYKNRYNVVGNILLYEFDTTQLQTIAQTICNKISDCAFRPNKTVMYSGIYMSLGQPYSVNSRLVNEDNVIDNTFNSVLLKRTISGIQAMFSTLEAMSSQYQPDISATDVLSDIKISKGKFSKFEHDLEHFQSELTDYETETNTKIEQTSEHILQTAAKNINDWDKENYNIKWENYDTPNKLMVGVSETQPIVGDYFLNVSNGKLYTLATVSRDTTLSDSNYNYYNVTYSYVKDLDSIQTTLSSQIEQTAESIKSTVANAQNTWIEEYPLGTPITIDYRGYGYPKYSHLTQTELDEYYPNIATGKKYLNIYDGIVYDVSSIITNSDSTKTIMWHTFGTLTSEKSEMYSTIEQTAESITSTVAKTQTVWLEEQPIGTPITIKYRDYGTPVGKTFSGLALNDLYLNVSTGQVYKMTNLSNNTWTYQYTLTSVESHTETQISQTNNQIVLKADNNGNLALVALGADPSTGTSFTVQADDISLAGKTIDLTSDEIVITSDHFSVDKFGNTHIESDGILKIMSEHYVGIDVGTHIDITSQFENMTYQGAYEVGESLPSGQVGQYAAVIDVYDRWVQLGANQPKVYIERDGNVNPNSSSSPYPPSQSHLNERYINLRDGKWYVCLALYNPSTQETTYTWNEMGTCSYLEGVGSMRGYDVNDGWYKAQDVYVYLNTAVFDLNGTTGLTLETPELTIQNGSADFTGTISGGSINIKDNFIVDYEGNATAHSLTVDGGTISGSEINGSEITGADIQTDTLTIKDKYDVYYYETEDEYTYQVKSATFTGHSTTGDEDRSVLRLDLGEENDGDGIFTIVGNRTVFNCDVIIPAGYYFTNNSDRRIKENFKNITEEYEKAYYEIKPIMFNFIGHSEKDIGLIAQDLEELLKKYKISDNNCFIHKTPDEELGTIYSIDYTKFIIYNMHMIQKQHNEINDLKEELATLKEQVAFLMGKEQNNG